jgi:cytochrome bd-type quinol oxidase subunit 1
METEILARVQFAFTVAFHYIYPPLSIGLGLILVIMEGMYLKTGLLYYKHMTQFWIKIFALIFGIGVATGIVMEFEFGTNWAAYSKYVGDIFGSALAAEGIFAFALESGCLRVRKAQWDPAPVVTQLAQTLVKEDSVRIGLSPCPAGSRSLVCPKSAFLTLRLAFEIGRAHD